ncbi:MAG TPA: dihydropteroate synthase [Terriglobia bacterium]|nr:dihydropteroate synthase [Terriglobia bacterium]
MNRRTFTLEIAGRKVRLGERTLVMGVLNATPDSFSDGGLYLQPGAAVERGLQMARQGADWIDVGGESTRPGSKPVAAAEELARVLPVIRGLHRRAPDLVISIDTTKAEVAREAVRAGAAMINDVSGLRFDPALAEVARRERKPLVLMHLRGRPETMQQGPFARSIARSLGRGLAWSIRQALERGVRRSQLLLDPGLGFGKTRRQNFEILASLGRLRRFGLPLVVGSSRKSFVQAVAAGEGLEAVGREPGTMAPWKLTAAAVRSRKEPPLALLVGDAAAVAAAVLGGAHVVRVHNVEAALPAVRIADAVLAARKGRTAK